MDKTVLQNIVDRISAQGKGILAADESTPTITKRFASIDVESTEANRRAYRECLLSTPNLEAYVSGVILFEETLGQATQAGVPFPELLKQKGIVPGIKVDKGLVPLEGTNGEKVTQGLEGLSDRLAQYKEQGAQFAKWRAVYQISDTTPSDLLINANAENLARYAKACQALNIVPIVEPEVLIDGDHTIERCAEVTDKVLGQVFKSLKEHDVDIGLIVLKPSMVIAGKDCKQQNSVAEVAQKTLEVFKRQVPEQVPTINFLSGGQTPEQATEHLNAMNTNPQPWHLSFSYGRALQEPSLKAWQGQPDNIDQAQQALYQRARLNSEAVKGTYETSMEG